MVGPNIAVAIIAVEVFPKDCPMKRTICAFLMVLGVLWAQKSNAFVLVGPMDPAELASGGIDFNYTDDLGGPKELKTFFRWNIPLLTYSFDASFMQYFGLEGREAVKEAFTAVNDFFENDEYSGVSELELTAHGFRSNYNTAWMNTTAKNAQVIDIKSLAMGLIVNQLGLGNPYRYAFGIHSTSTNSAGTQINFNVRQRNYDPITYKPSSLINNVNFSYRLIHDAPPSVGVTTLPTFADMEEFTTDTTGNAWTSLSAITDAFYGNTAIFWTEQPTLFGFGIYYDGRNALGGHYKPRHALTYDDAGGLKYLYRTNNYVYENLDPNVVLMVPASFLPTFAIPVFPGGGGRIYPDPTGISGAYVPRRNAGLIPGLPITSSVPVQAPPALVDVAMRGGIDKIQFREQQFDSFLGINFTATTHEWTDIFVSTNGQNVVNLNNTTPGSSAFIGVPTLKHFSQKVGRAIFQPDILFVADELGVSPDGIPIAFNRTDNTAWVDNYTNNLGPAQLLTTNVGPGVITGPIQYTFTKLGQGFEVIWSGEASVVGNTNTYSLWGHIKGPGPGDIVVFPNDAQMSILENAVSPATAVPVISRIEDSGQDGRLTRTQEDLIIEGSNLASVTAIQIMNGNLVLQTIQGSVVQTFINSHNQIIIPPGHISESTEGADGARQIVLWNTVGKSTSSSNIGIDTGNPVVTGTSRDNLTYDRAEHNLGIFGYGFKSSQIFAADGNSTLSYFRIEASDGSVVYPRDGNSSYIEFEIKSDSHAILPVNAANYLADGAKRLIRVARSPDANTLSSTNNLAAIANITTKPVINTLGLDSKGNYRRDEALTISGVALNTARRIEIVHADGSELAPRMYLDLPYPGVSVDENGGRIQISKNSFFTSQADGHGPDSKRKFKITNAISDTDDNNTFNVNSQPELTFIAGFTTPFTFNRDAVTGDDIVLTGSNLLGISEIQMVDENGTTITGTPKITLPVDGVEVTNTSIAVDTQTVQFGNGTYADSTINSKWRRFKLVSDREAALSPQNIRFQVGTPPVISSYITTAGTTNYRRDADTLTLSGTGFSLVSKAEIVDAQGRTIALNSEARENQGLTIISSTQLSIAPNSFIHANLLDNSNPLSRRIKITSPFGVKVSDLNASGAFSLSATPSYHSSASTTFAGGGYNGGINTYYSKNGDLKINGQNFLGVKTLTLEDNASNIYLQTNLTPGAQPPGFQMNNDGTQITISANHLISNSNGWHDSNGVQNRRVKLTSAADQNATTQTIITSPDLNVFGAISSLTGSGFVSATDFERNGTLIINGANLVEANSVTLVEANGSDISGVAPLTNANGITFGATDSITVPANAFNNDGNETDTTASLGRRVKITFSNGNPAVYSTAASGFTVSNIASYAGDSNASFFGSGSGGSEDDNNTATPEFDYNGSGGGNLVINGTNFMGIKNVYLMDSDGSDANGTMVTLSRTAIEGASGTFTHERITIPAGSLGIWLDNNGSFTHRHVVLESASDRNQTSPIIGVD